MRISDGSLVVVDPDGAVEEGVDSLLGSRCETAANIPDLPSGLTTDDLDLDALLAGDTQSGVAGDTAFVARPLAAVGDRTPVLVVTQDVESRPLGQAGGWFLVTGAIALAVAAISSAGSASEAGSLPPARARPYQTIIHLHRPRRRAVPEKGAASFALPSSPCGDGQAARVADQLSRRALSTARVVVHR